MAAFDEGMLVEAEIKERRAALIRQMVAVGIIIFLLMIWMGLRP